MPFRYLPVINDCCGCVTDLKTAAAIIAVLGIVSSPAVSWAVIRHTYAIRVSCIISSSLSRPDVVDVSLNNILSFGFSANAGLGPSCLSKNRTKPTPPLNTIVFRAEDASSSKMVSAVRYVGWAVLVADFVFVCCSVILLVKIFNGPDKDAVKFFMITAVISMLLSFIYCMLFVAACVSVGGSFPVVEFIFAFIDLFKWAIWIHYLLVMRTYSKYFNRLVHAKAIYENQQNQSWIPWWIYDWLNRWITENIPLRRNQPTSSRR